LSLSFARRALPQALRILRRHGSTAAEAAHLDLAIEYYSDIVLCEYRHPIVIVEGVAAHHVVPFIRDGEKSLRKS
jgi:hypothetical protein